MVALYQSNAYDERLDVSMLDTTTFSLDPLSFWRTEPEAEA